MSNNIMKIENLHVGIDGKEILKGIDLEINAGETHVIMGPNGAGKSTLMNAIMSHPKYEVTDGDIIYKGKSILDEDTHDRAKDGIFMSFQQAYEIPGLTLENFLRGAKGAVTGKNPGILQFRKQLYAEMESLDMDTSYASRDLNVGFSGGEKKKSEILQMKILDPTLSLLDETDSGLDVDAVKIVSEGVASWLDDTKATIIITHHERLLESLNPDFVHILLDGKIVMTDDYSLVSRVAEEGYGWIKEMA